MAKDICAHIGRSIQVYRRESGLYQIDLAEKATITRRNLSKIETGKADASISTLHRIAKALNLTLSQLLEGID